MFERFGGKKFYYQCCHTTWKVIRPGDESRDAPATAMNPPVRKANMSKVLGECKVRIIENLIEKGAFIGGVMTSIPFLT